MKTSLFKVDDFTYIKKESELPYGWKTRGLTSLKDKPYFVISCGNWGSAVIENRAGSVLLRSENYSLIDENKKLIKYMLDLEIAEFDGNSTSECFLEIRESLGFWPDAIVAPASGISFILGAMKAGVPDRVQLWGLCTDKTPNAYNLFYKKTFSEKMNSNFKSLYCTGGRGVPSFSYDWWTNEHHNRLSGVILVNENVISEKSDHTFYGSLCLFGIRRLRFNDKSLKCIVGIETK